MIGLLVDDAVSARRRAAVEIYGTLELPKWWVDVPSAGDARRELDPARCANLRVLILDRMIPDHPNGTRRDWSTTTGEPFGPLRERVYEVQSQGSPVICEYITSHASTPDGGWPGWRDRCRAPLFELRPRLREAGLLRYGLQGSKLEDGVDKALTTLTQKKELTIFLGAGCDPWTSRAVRDWLCSRIAGLSVVSNPDEAHILVGHDTATANGWIYVGAGASKLGAANLQDEPPCGFFHDLWEAWQEGELSRLRPARGRGSGG